MKINIVVAATENDVIGKDNRLLWHLPNDMAFFKNTTWGMPVIMGRKTFDSMGKPLKGRTNIIVTRSQEMASAPPEGAVVTSSLEDAISIADETDANECYIIGGGEIFRLSMDIAHKIFMTRVHTKLEGDVFFPRIDENLWRIATAKSFPADEKHAFPYTFEIWQRK